MPDFDELVDLLRDRLFQADAINGSELHSFKGLMDDQAELLPGTWYSDAFMELEALGHVDPKASYVGHEGDAFARLSNRGRRYVSNDT